MAGVHIYPQHELPQHWFYQIISFLRINFTDGFVGKLQFRNWISSPRYHPVHLVIGHEDILIAHTEVLSKTLVHNGKPYRVYGLSGVLTYPAFRGQGYGKQVVQLGMDYIRRQPDADVGLVTCEEHNVGFYQKCGWDFTNNVVLAGDKSSPEASNERTALMYVSDHARRNRQDFETIPIYFGEHLW